jgi:hypothetical protein
MMSVLVYLNTYVNNVFRISYARLGPTEIRVMAILANTVVFFAGNPSIQLPYGLGEFSFYNGVALLIALALIFMFVVVSIRQAVDLNKIDRDALAMRAKRTARQSRARRGRRQIGRSVPAAED